MKINNIIYWRQGESLQNFGDFLSELISEIFNGPPKIQADIYRIVGSCISEWMNWQDLSYIGSQDDGCIAYWGCGMRDENINPYALRKFKLLGARGPLTRDALGMAADTPLVDSGLLMPIIHAPRRCGQANEKTVFMPHFNETDDLNALLGKSGCDIILDSKVKNDKNALRAAIDIVAGCDFLLTQSLHGAIIATAYHVPFSFGNIGHLDFSFKYEDFCKSINLPVNFVGNVEDGRKFYQKSLAHIRRQPLIKLIEVCPFPVDDIFLKRAQKYDNITKFINQTLDSALCHFSIECVNMLAKSMEGFARNYIRNLHIYP